MPPHGCRYSPAVTTASFRAARCRVDVPTLEPPARTDRTRSPRRLHLPARSRRDAWGRGAGRPGLPRRVLLGIGRLPRGFDLLHPLRLPDHDAAATRAAPHRIHRAEALLGSSFPSAHACGTRLPRGRVGVRGHGRHARADGEPPGRHDRLALLRGQLALHRRWCVVRRVASRRRRPCCTSGRWPSRSSSTWCSRWWWPEAWPSPRAHVDSSPASS